MSGLGVGAEIALVVLAVVIVGFFVAELVEWLRARSQKLDEDLEAIHQEALRDKENAHRLGRHFPGRDGRCVMCGNRER